MHAYFSFEWVICTGEVENADNVKFWLEAGRDCSETTAVYVVWGGISSLMRVLGESR